MPTQDKTQTPQEIIREILPLTNQRRIDPAVFLKLTERLGIVDSSAKIYFLRELNTIVRQLPLKAFENADDRLRLIDAVQAALDEAIEEEEELLS